MPPVELAPSPLGTDYAEFRTRCGRVAGTALRTNGCNETDYQLVAVRRANPTEHLRMEQVSDRVAAFDVVGCVAFVFEDGLAEIDIHGFTFWIPPDAVEGPMRIGDRIACRVEDLQLYC